MGCAVPNQPLRFPPPPRTAAKPAPPAQLQTFRILPQLSRASYTAHEKWLKPEVSLETVIGYTSQVSGEIRLDPQRPASAIVGLIHVSLLKLTTDDEERDVRVQELYIETHRFPLAVFTPTQSVGLPEVYAVGSPIRFSLHGELNIRSRVRPVAFGVVANLSGDVLTGTAETMIRMSDFGIPPPSKRGLSVVQDEMTVRLTFVATRLITNP
jgi:polyisoprenoid-binding protein YceI